MGKYLLKRFCQSLIAVIGITIVVFLILHLTGDPVELMVSPSTPTEQMEILREELGFNDPLHVQYFHWIRNMLHGDFGMSYYYHEPVLKVVMERLPATLKLAFAGFIISVVLGIPAGIISAVKRNSVTDGIIRISALLGQCLPTFWLGIMLIMFFGVTLGCVPTGGDRDGIKSLILPAFSLGVFSAATICRLLRSNMIEVLGKEYIIAAKAKGLHSWCVIIKHGFKNSFSSILTILGMQIASLIGGSVITETVFAWPGVGRLVIQSIQSCDFAVVQCIVFFMALIFVVTNFIVDILYSVINPQVRLQ